MNLEVFKSDAERRPYRVRFKDDDGSTIDLGRAHSTADAATRWAHRLGRAPQGAVVLARRLRKIKEQG